MTSGWEELIARVSDMVDARLRMSNENDDDNRRDIAEMVSEQLMGDRRSPYVYGLMDKMFRPNYDRKKEWGWLVRDATEKRHRPIRAEEKELEYQKLRELHREYARHLWRCADVEAIKGSMTSPEYPDSEDNKISASVEAKCVSAFLSYLKRCAEIVFGIGDAAGRKDGFATLVDVFVSRLYYLPRKADLLAFSPTAEFGGNEAHDPISEDDVVAHIRDTDDFKYLEQCRRRFDDLSPFPITADRRSGASVKYYGPIGTSGFAKMTRNIVDSLYHMTDFDIQFSVLQFHNFNESTGDEALLSSLAKRDLGPRYDFVIIHSTPDLWPTIARKERANNPDVRIYGITVWEAHDLPPRWDVYLRFVDKVSVPSEFSAVAMRKVGIYPDVVHHPVIDRDSGKEDKCPLANPNTLLRAGDKEDVTVFYNISEWTNRKGLSELVDAFVTEFLDDEGVLLYLKTYGDIGIHEAATYIGDVRLMRGLSPPGISPVYEGDDCEKRVRVGGNIVLDYARVSDSYIDCLHSCADCYVSTCKSEGHGVGVCYAALACKPILVTGYGGQTDYLLEDPVDGDRKVTFMSYGFEPACFCTTWSSKHRACRYLPHCRFFEGFVPENQRWARPDLEDCRRQMRRVAVEQRRQRLDRHRASPMDVTDGTRETRARRFILDKFDRRARAAAFRESVLSTPSVVRDIIPSIRDHNPKPHMLTGFGYTPQSAFYVFRRIRPLRLLVVNCCGYGNVGDDSYGKITRSVLQSGGDGSIEVCVVPDRFVLVETTTGDHHGGYRGTKNLRLVEVARFRNGGNIPRTKLARFDAVVFGGGGLLYPEKFTDADNAMGFYATMCRESRIPYYVISVGFQGIETRACLEDVRRTFARKEFTSFLNSAELVSVRSVVDFRVAADLMTSSAIERLSYHPDLAYATRALWRKSAPESKSKRNVIMVVVSDWANLKRNVLLRDVRETVIPGKDEVVFANWGGLDARLTDAEAVMQEEVKRAFPEGSAKLVSGVKPDLDFLAREAPERTTTMEDMWSLLLRTKVLYTGRYHSLVLGRAASVPRIETFDYMNYKFEADSLSGHGDLDADALAKRALAPLLWVRSVMTKGIPNTDRSASASWTDDYRNTTIVECNVRRGIDVPMLQNLTNVRLHELLSRLAAKEDDD